VYALNFEILKFSAGPETHFKSSHVIPTLVQQELPTPKSITLYFCNTYVLGNIKICHQIHGGS